MDDLALIGRSTNLFNQDICRHNSILSEMTRGSRFLVIGGAGSIGKAVCKEIFSRKPLALHVIDLSENNLVELVRDLRSSKGYIDGDFRTFAIDCGSDLFKALLESEGPYDYIFNLSALKHVRSEKDPYTLMRMIEVNILNTIKTLDYAASINAKNYFCVSTDKAANPVNMMGASKRIMEMFLMRGSLSAPISTARFANVAFSDGSLLHGFNQRIQKKQPIAAPSDIRRYFLTPQESGQLCLMSGLMGENRDIFFPKLSEDLHLITFSKIATNYLQNLGYEAIECASEEEARVKAPELIRDKKWPCYFFESDTTGEKDFEEFYTSTEELDFIKYQNIGVIKNQAIFNDEHLKFFLRNYEFIRKNSPINKPDIIDLFNTMIPNFSHLETGKYLDQKM
jgi:FlaA1/EpsC-like NDP-sugar epimerase